MAVTIQAAAVNYLCPFAGPCHSTVVHADGSCYYPLDTSSNSVFENATAMYVAVAERAACILRN